MKNRSPKFYSGKGKRWIDLGIKVRTGFFAIGLVMKGEMKPRYLIRYMKRLLFFLSKMKENKYARTTLGIKVNLYVPAFPSKAYFYACKKMLHFEGELPAITALVSVTSACRYDCEHCYQKLDKGKDVDIDVLVDTVKKMQDRGVAFFNIEGGEPFLVYPRLKKVCDAIDRRSEILINSTGDGMTVERLLELKKKGNFLGIMFSLHTYKPEVLNSFMRSDKAWENLEKGIEMCHQAGVSVTFNSCLRKEDYFNGTFEKVMQRARDFGGVIIQMIKPKPAGNWLLKGADVFTDTELKLVAEKLIGYNNHKSFKAFTSIAPMIIDESREYFGCTAGGTDRYYVNAKGDVQPCEFLNISFGNITEEPFEDIYRRMRVVFREPGDCWLCEKYSPMVGKLFMENGLDSLPLSPELSKKIYENLEKGNPADFYEKVYKI